MIFRFSLNVLSAGTKEPVNATGSSARVGLPFKIPERAHLLATRKRAAVVPSGHVRSPKGSCDLCGDLQPMSPCLWARRASAARLTRISRADSDQHGKYAIDMILMPVNSVCKPATGSFAGEDACGHPSLLC